jgi:prepilin signal peptidase PulO-like enzyme (type II secretory pathway)
MLDAIQGIPFAYVLCGVIWAIAMGFAVGNYACSLVYRLPRGKLLLDKTPYCGSCGTLLKVKDLFPVVSALLLRHRCRYCGTKFPVSHTWTELLVGLLFVLAFLQHNFTEHYILIVAIGVFLITLAAIEANESIIMGKVVLCIVVFGMLYRTLQDGTIYNFFQGGMAGLLLGAILWRRQIKPVGHIYSLPKPVELLIVGGICVGLGRFFDFLFLFAALHVAFWLLARIMGSKRPTLSTVPFGFAVMIPVLYPQFSFLSRLIQP